MLAVAHALETHLTITGDDVMAILDGSEGPFIDGAGYYRQEAIEKLEAYHSAVLDYRRRGIEGLPPLPEIEGVTGRIVSSVVSTGRSSQSRSPSRSTPSAPWASPEQDSSESATPEVSDDPDRCYTPLRWRA